MKIVSWNIAGAHTFVGGLEDALSYEGEDIKYFIKQLRKSDADVVCLQEVHIPLNQKGFSQPDIIANNLGYRFVETHIYGSKSHIKSGQQLALSTLSRIPVEKSYFHKLPNPNLKIKRPNGDVWVSFDVGFLVSELNYNGRKIYVLNTHLVPFHHFERDFCEPVFKHIRDDISDFLLGLSKEPTVVVGDFNFADLKKLIPKVFANGQYREAFENIETTPGRGQQDHILFSSQFDPGAFEVNVERADHYLCEAVFRWDSNKFR